MVPGVMVTVNKSEKVLWVHGGKTEDVILYVRTRSCRRRLTTKLFRLSLASLSA